MASKIDMSLDEIIKMEKKNRQRPGGSKVAASGKNATSKSNRGAAAAQSRRGGRRSMLAVRRRVARPKFTTNVNVSRVAGNVRATNQGRPRVSVGRRSTFGKLAGQRVARNLLQRAMVRKRRQAISLRSDNLNQSPAKRNADPRRLVEQVRKWRNTAKLLHTALQIEAAKNQRQRIRLPSDRIRFQTNESTSLHNRLGWRDNRQNSFKQGNINKNIQINRIGGVQFGQMQSDLLSRQRETEKRIEAEVLARYQSQSSFPNRRSGRRNFSPNSGISFKGRNNNRGRGLQSRNDFAFTANRMRAFGGGAGASVKSYRGRFNNRQRNF